VRAKLLLSRRKDDPKVALWSSVSCLHRTLTSGVRRAVGEGLHALIAHDPSVAARLRS